MCSRQSNALRICGSVAGVFSRMEDRACLMWGKFDPSLPTHTHTHTHHLRAFQDGKSDYTYKVEKRTMRKVKSATSQEVSLCHTRWPGLLLWLEKDHGDSRPRGWCPPEPLASLHQRAPQSSRQAAQRLLPVGLPFSLSRMNEGQHGPKLAPGER